MFALAFALTGAPVTTIACQSVCASRSSTSVSGGAEHHSCHAELPPHAPAASGSAHSCRHSDDVPLGTYKSVQMVIAPAITAATFSFTPNDAALRSRSTNAEQGPSDFLAFNRQLRV